MTGPLSEGAQQLCRLFQLTDSEQALIGFLLAQDGGATLRQVRQALPLRPDDLGGLMTPDAHLRAHAIIEIAGDSDAALGVLRQDDRLLPGRGLEQIWDGAWDKRLPIEDALGLPGIEFYPAPPPETAWAQDVLAERAPPVVTTLVREHLLAHEARLVEVPGFDPALVATLARLCRGRLLRPVITLDASALGFAQQGPLMQALRRLRRDADLRGAVIIASDGQALGAGWRGLCAPQPAGHTTPVVLLHSGALRLTGPMPAARRGEARLMLHSVAQKRAAEEEGAAKNENSEAKEEVRRKAAIDAARAMGKPIPKELAETAKAPSAATPPAAAAAPAAEAIPPWVKRAEEYHAAVGDSPPPRRRPRQHKPDEAAAAPPASAASGDSDGKTQAAASPSSPPAGQAPDESPGQAEVGVAAAPASAGTPVPIVEPDPLPLADDAPLDEVVRVTRTTPNTPQRLALLKALEGKKAAMVIQTFRAFLASPQQEVREAAEAGMSSIFGPDWNRSRPIPPPVQPPRSDDGGRGPGGAF